MLVSGISPRYHLPAVRFDESSMEKETDMPPQPSDRPDSGEVEVSFVMPCLNEAETLETCIAAAGRCISENILSAEIIVADNGSTDGSQDIASGCGARVVNVTEKGYGSALMGGIEAARGRYIIMGDADASYDFAAAMPFIEKLRAGCDLVMGSRLKGTIEPGAMPWKHRWIGNPVLTTIGRVLFRSGVSDFHCGLRAFSKEAYHRMMLRTAGMEFASEMIVKASLLKMKIAEIPVTLYRHGRSRPPHLRSWRDGWRHLRFMLICSPQWLFLYPGLLLLLVGLGIGAWLLPGPGHIGKTTFDVHTLAAAAAICIIGAQLIWFAMFAKTFAAAENLLPSGGRFNKIAGGIRLETGLVAGLVMAIAGIALMLWALDVWASGHFGPLDYQKTMRKVIPATMLAVLGIQAIFSSFMLSVLQLRRRSR